MDDQDQPTDVSQFGAAAPIFEPVAKAYDHMRRFFKSVPSAPVQAPPAQHADPGMVDEANKTFQKRAEQEKAEAQKAQTKKTIKPAPRKR